MYRPARRSNRLIHIESQQWILAIAIQDDEEHKTAFISHHALYRFMRRPFRVLKAPGTFQRTMDVIIFSVK